MREKEPLEIAKQEKSGWCFLACAEAILKFYGEERTQEELKEVFQTTEEHGTSIYNAIDGFMELGYDVRYKTRASVLDLLHCLKAELPVVVCWLSDFEGEPEGHYSIVENILIDHSPKASHSNMIISLLDPEIGKRRAMPFREFEKRWFGIEDNKRIERPMIIVYQEGK